MIWIKKLIRWLAKSKKASKAAIGAAEKAMAEHLKDAEYWGKKAFKEKNPEIKKAYQKFEQDYLRKAAEEQRGLHDLKTVAASLDADTDVFIAQLVALDRTLATADLLVGAIDFKWDQFDGVDDEAAETSRADAHRVAGSSSGAQTTLGVEFGEAEQ
jgi:hypothetical protein